MCTDWTTAKAETTATMDKQRQMATVLALNINIRGVPHFD
jgi:hypothetical protein